MAYALATPQIPGINQPGVQKTNPYQVPTYGGGGAARGPFVQPPQESTSNATPGYTPQAPAPAPAPMAPPLPQPAAAPPAAAPASVSALSGVGLGSGFQDALANEGWRDDDMSDLATVPGRTLPASSRALQELVAQKRGRAY